MRVDLQIAPSSNYLFPNTNQGDVIFKTTDSNVGVHFGSSSIASNALLSIQNSLVKFGGINSNVSIYDGGINVSSNTGLYGLGDGQLGLRAGGSNFISLCNDWISLNTNVSMPAALNLKGLIINKRDENGPLNVSVKPTFLTNGCNVYVGTGSNLGIGTFLPTQALDVSGNIATGGVVRVTSGGVLQNVTTDASNITTGTFATARLPTASTLASGIVQLTDSTTTTNSALAATATAVKTAYEIGSNALPRAGGTVIGNVTVENNALPTLIIRNTSSNSTAFGSLQLHNDLGLCGILFQNSSTRTLDGPINALTLRNDRGVVRLLGSNYEGVFVDGTGYVGIGLSNPAYRLDVLGDVNFTGSLRQNGSAYQGSQWSTVGSNVVIVSSNVGIGLSNPAYRLDVLGDVNLTGTLRQNGIAFSSGGGGSGWVASNTSNLFTFCNVGVGLSNPQYPVHVTNASNSISIYATGDVVGLSDERLKTNFSVIEDAMNKVKKLNGYTFQYKTDPSSNLRAGLIAQEVLQVLPEVVSQDNMGYYNLAYGNISAMLVNAIKEINDRLEKVESRLEQ